VGRGKKKKREGLGSDETVRDAGDSTDERG
jgi:hypothetical protein